MRKTFILAIIACILGIVLLAAIAFYIPARLGNEESRQESELFTGFNYSTEAARQSDSAKEEAAGGGQTSPVKEQQTGTASETLTDSSARKDSPESEQAHSADQAAGTKDEKPGTESDIESSNDKTQTASQKQTGTQKQTSAKDANVKEHRIIWVGDSRTLGLRDALGRVERDDDDLFVGKVGEGVHWFQEEGMAELSDMIEENPELPVVMNFGVNDPQLVDEYVVTYWDVIHAHPDTTFYILSVNPLDEEFLLEDGLVEEAVFEDINSLNVAKMNVKLKEEFSDRYIDSASYLKSDGFDTVDGLHFSTETYLKIHDFVVDRLF